MLFFTLIARYHYILFYDRSPDYKDDWDRAVNTYHIIKKQINKTDINKIDINKISKDYNFSSNIDKEKKNEVFIKMGSKFKKLNTVGSGFLLIQIYYNYMYLLVKK